MDASSINALVIGIFLIVLALSGLVFGIFYVFSEKQQKARSRLTKMRQKYAVTGKAGQTRSVFAETANVTTIEQMFRQILPNIDIIKLRLAKTGRKLTIVHYGLMILSFGTLSFLTFLVLFNVNIILSALMGIIIGAFLPHLLINGMIKKRILSFITLFPDALDLIVRGLRSGLPITESMNSVASEVEDPVGGEFRRVMDQIRLGKNLDEALEETAQRIDSPEFKFFVISLAIQRETGGNLAETLSKLSDLLRRRQQMKLKIKAMASEGKASAHIVGALPFVMFFMLLLINYNYTSVLFTDQRAIYIALGGMVWARYAASGHLLYVTADGTLMAVPFDETTLTLTGDAVALVEGVRIAFAGNTDLAVSATGTLFYTTGGFNVEANDELVWVTRNGTAEEIHPGWTENFQWPKLSPDGTRLATDDHPLGGRLARRNRPAADARRPDTLLQAAGDGRPAAAYCHSGSPSETPRSRR